MPRSNWSDTPLTNLLAISPLPVHSVGYGHANLMDCFRAGENYSGGSSENVWGWPGLDRLDFASGEASQAGVCHVESG